VQGLEINEFIHLSLFDSEVGFEPNDFKLTSDHIKAMIFTFKYDINLLKEFYEQLKCGDQNDSIFFANQTAKQACGTYALINILMSLKKSDPNISEYFKSGQILSFLQEVAENMSPMDAGDTIAGFDEIKEIHNSFASPNMLEISEDELKYDKSSNEICHFVSFMPINGHLYEFDGLKKSIVDHGEIPPNLCWIKTVHDVIKKYISCFKTSENSFCLLSVEKSNLLRIDDKLKNPNISLEEKQSLVLAKEYEKVKLINYQKQNEFRRLNFFPMIVKILKLYARQGELYNQMKR
ncbi:MAG: ubiquitin carboxyl-terminal hydrolase, partial [Paramarteilia canceri]